MTDSPAANGSILHCDQLGKRFFEGGRELTVLDSLDLTVMPAESIAIVGASGSGKTTLLQLLGGLDTPSAGDVYLREHKLSALGEVDRGQLRNELMGFVYQFHHLLPEFSALENVAMPLLVRRASRKEAYAAARAILSDVGLAERLDHKPAKLSGGERQRAAVARAMVTQPALILADEPTGNLDGQTGARVFDRMLELNRAAKTSLVVVTHDMRIAQRLDRIMKLSGGRLVETDAS